MLFGDGPLALGARQKAHRDGVMAGRAGRAPACGPIAQQRVRHLDHAAGPVADQRIGADRAAMVEIDQDLQPARMMSCDFRPLMLATKPTPHESCSLRGS